MTLENSVADEITTIKGIRRKPKKQLIIMWCGIVALIIALIATTLIQWNRYVTAQESAIAATEIFQEVKGTNRKEKAKELYDYLTMFSFTRDADKSLGELLTVLGFDCYYGSDYLKCTDYFEYIINSYKEVRMVAIALAGILVIVIIVTFIYAGDKRSIVVSAEDVTAKKYSGKTFKLLPKNISVIEKNGNGTLLIKGDSIRYKITRLVNRDQLIEALESLRKDVNNDNVKNNTGYLEELSHLNEYLKKGIITQEEFEKKKKSILGL